MSENFHPKEYLNEKGIHDFDKMESDMWYCKRFKQKFTPLTEWTLHPEYDEYNNLVQDAEEEILLVKQKYNKLINELQNRCNHYWVKQNKKEYCIKCKQPYVDNSK